MVKFLLMVQTENREGKQNIVDTLKFERLTDVQDYLESFVRKHKVKPQDMVYEGLYHADQMRFNDYLHIMDITEEQHLSDYTNISSVGRHLVFSSYVDTNGKVYNPNGMLLYEFILCPRLPMDWQPTRHIHQCSWWVLNELGFMVAMAHDSDTLCERQSRLPDTHYYRNLTLCTVSETIYGGDNHE